MAYEARSSNDIYTEIVNEIQTMDAIKTLEPAIDNEQSLLEDLTKPSKVARWRLFSWVIAYITSLFENNIVEFENDITELIDNTRYGSKKWYIQKALEYQDGYSLVVNEDTLVPEYETIDESAKIIKYASIIENDGVAIIKVKGSSGALTTDEKNRFQIYLDKIKVLGTKISARSVNSDKLTLNMKIVHNGLRDINSLRSDVESIISNYITNLDFDGRFKVISMIDLLQQVQGIEDIQFISGSGVSTLGITTNFTYDYQSYAGWNEINGTTPLSDTIQYEIRYV